MKTLRAWLEGRYLDWQREHGLISLNKWAKVLGISYTNLMGMMSGERTGTTMQTAYQIGERLNDFSILQVLGYPIPAVPLAGFTSEQREVVLDFLEKVKTAMQGLPPDEQDAKLKVILDGLPEADTEVN